MKNPDFITVDGHRFHFDWLRDNCPCPDCRDASSYQKIHDPTEREAVPRRVELLDDALVLTWEDDPKPHRIGRAWLGANAYDRQQRDAAPDERIMWESARLL